MYALKVPPSDVGDANKLYLNFDRAPMTLKKRSNRSSFGTGVSTIRCSSSKRMS